MEVRPLVSQGDSPNLDIGRQVNTTTEEAIASSQRVVERGLALIEAADQLSNDDLDDPELEALAATIEIPGEDARAVQEQLEVTVPSGSEILKFTAIAGRPERAQDLAQAMAHAYLDFRSDAALRSTESARAQLVAREAVLLDDLNVLAADIGAAGNNEAEVQGLLYQEVSKRQELAGIGSSLANIATISINVGEVLDDADLPTSSSGLPSSVPPIAGLVLGGTIGLATAFLLDRTDDRVRDPEAELTQLGLDIFGYAPATGDQIARATANTDDSDEKYRRIQASLLYKLEHEQKSVILVAGPNNPRSSSNVAASLAVAAARAGRETLLIGADLRQPHMHERFGLQNGIGLSDVLAARCTIREAIVNIPELKTLEVLTAGSQVAQPTVVLQGPNLGQRLIPNIQKEFDLVIFEAPPLMQSADAVVLGRMCDAAVLVVEAGRSSRSDVTHSVDQLRGVGADVIGTVVVDTLKG